MNTRLNALVKIKTRGLSQIQKMLYSELERARRNENSKACKKIRRDLRKTGLYLSATRYGLNPNLTKLVPKENQNEIC